MTDDIPAASKKLGRTGAALPQMLRRCCWPSMTFTKPWKVI